MLRIKQAVIAFSFSLAKNSINLSKNYYKILEVDTACDQKRIKNSYLKLVKKLHPDVNPNGKEKFTEVQQAYEVLSDEELKKYYDQNNQCSRGGVNNHTSGQQTHSSQSRTTQSKTGYQYYTHRTYASENPRDYFYTDNQPKYQKAGAKTNTYYKYEEDQDEGQANRKGSNFNRDEKRSQSQASWEEFQRQRKQRQEKAYPSESAEDRIMRDRLKAMRGFTSSYNVMWARYHIRYSDLLDREALARKKQQQIRSLMPEKVRKFYDKLMQKIQKLAQQ